MVAIFRFAVLALLSISLCPTAPEPSWASTRTNAEVEPQSYIVQGNEIGLVRQAVLDGGGVITHELEIIEAIAADLTGDQSRALLKKSAIRRIFANPTVEVTGTNDHLFSDDDDGDNDDDDGDDDDGDDDDDSGNGNGNGNGNNDDTFIYTDFPRRVRADLLHPNGLTGAGVTVAVLDSGIFKSPALLKNSEGQPRLLAYYDAIHDDSVRRHDRYGHGSHVTSVLAGSTAAEIDNEEFANSIAPDIDLVIVKAFDLEGRGCYADVIRGLDWLLSNQQQYGIRIVNLSFGAAPRSFYWDDPLNQAVMALWRAGVVVVTAAGNDGPAPMTITAPGNVPYVITVGAMSDAFTPDDPTDDYLTTFSSAGPTAEGFVKPDLVAPGGHILGHVGRNSLLAQLFPHRKKDQFFELSGTSQAAAIVSGTAALVLQDQPWLTPDEVKCRLMASAQAATDAQGGLAYSPLQQGAGLVDAYRAVLNRQSGCVNRGLSIDDDLFATRHFSGPVRLDDQRRFHMPGVGFAWGGGFQRQAATWNGGNPWLNGDPWIEGQGDPWIEGQGDPWIEGQGDPWLEGDPWIEGQAWEDQNPWLETEGDPWIEGSGDPWIETGSWQDPAWIPDLDEVLEISTVNVAE